MKNFIKNKNIKNNRKDNISNITGFGQAAWSFISAIYKEDCDVLKTNNYNLSFCQKVLANSLTISYLPNLARNLKRF